MTSLREAAQQALEALGYVGADWICEASHHAKKDQHKLGEPCPLQQRWHVAYQALRAALAEPVQEPVALAWSNLEGTKFVGNGEKWKHKDCVVPLYTSPPQRKPLTEEEIEDLMKKTWGNASIAPRSAPDFARAIERAHGIGEKK